MTHDVSGAIAEALTYVAILSVVGWSIKMTIKGIKSLVKRAL
jgi:hypothetical protein